MPNKIDLPEDLKIMRPEGHLNRLEWVYDPAPWLIKDIFGDKIAQKVLREQIMFKARTSRLESEYLEKIARVVGK